MGSIKSTFSILLVLVFGCQPKENPTAANSLFRLIPPENSQIDFVNSLTYTEEINPYTFKNFYNGGGVGLGDFNQDGLLDIFFSGNQVSNRLYLNQGNFSFKDITESAGLFSEGSWTTGISIADINADGLPDIYLCKSGPPDGKDRHNQLWINNGDLTFTEWAEQYGLNFKGLSTHAAFFDYDQDGDLDCYLLNNSIRSVGGYDLRKDQRLIPDALGGNKLLRNDSGKYVDVSQTAGIYTSEIGFGLGVTIGDVNLDGWLDIYVSNDFFERDYLYINQQNGSFKETLQDYITELSMGSMGADMADINNDCLPDIFVTEMLPETDDRLKTKAQFENWDKYKLSASQGYGHQFGRNVLQVNTGNGTFREIGRLAGVHATDWSWGALIFDMDNDGLKDIFVANGIYKDLLDQDFVNFIANPAMIRNILKEQGNVIKRLVDSIPSNSLANYAFHNQGDLRFVNQANEWGLNVPTFSNGSAYGDLDNDGDQDLILNNVNMPAFLYENRANEVLQNNSVTINLNGPASNRHGLGAKIKMKTESQWQYQEVSPMRGFMSTVDTRLHFGLGSAAQIDSIIVTWPGGKESLLTGQPVNQFITVDFKSAHDPIQSRKKSNPSLLFNEVKPNGVNFVHRENEFNDFDRDRLLFNMISNEGPCLCVGDVNNDGLDDFYVGGAKGQAGVLYQQTPSGNYLTKNKALFQQDQESEDTGCIFFDANKDGLLDLYVASGSIEFSSSAIALADRLYFNTGNGQFKKSNQILPVTTRFESTAAVDAADYDQDGDLDLFVGVRSIPFAYGLPGNGYILNNDGKGVFTNVTQQICPALLEIGMITAARWGDINQDLQPDLVVAGEWMPIRSFINVNGSLVDQSNDFGLSQSNGWYHTLELTDLNGDGKLDIIAGNHGLNSQFKASLEQPVSLYINDFDQNGTLEQITTRYNGGTSFPLVLRNDLVSQIPALKKKFLHFRDYAGQRIEDIFPKALLDQSIRLDAYTLETALWLSQPDSRLVRSALPVEAQFTPVYSILSNDFDQDGKIDLLLGGNLYRAKPETGIYDGSFGVYLKGHGNGTFTAKRPDESGLFVKGEIRAMRFLKTRQNGLVVVARNSDSLVFLLNE
ncbi:MAG: VCBS repeat-containing protein [Cyclobacteriaceae bacterium]|nr:VCBS repeat-containing protein [Cyclobacteriaceae bacterium]